MLEKLMINPYAWAALAIIAIVSFVYAVICQRKNKEKKELSYRQQSNSLIIKKKSKYEKLSINYDGQQIEDLSVSKFVVWNSGNRTLERDDMVPSKELTVSSSNDHIILDAELVAITEETNRFCIKEIGEHSVKIDFDYIDKKDGIVLQILHTGTKEDLSIDCKIKGGNPINNASPKKPIFNKSNQLSMGITIAFLVIATLFILLLTVLSTIAIFNPKFQTLFTQTMNSLIPDQQSLIIMSITSWLYSLIVVRIIVFLVKSVFNVGIPKSLKGFAELE